MADEHGGNAFGLHILNDGKEGLDLLFGQCRGGLVHDDQLDAMGQGAADGHDLLVGQGDVFDVFIEGQADPNPVHGILSHAPDVAPVDKGPLFGNRAAQGYVLGHGQVREKGQVLIDHLDSPVDGVDSPIVLDLLTVDLDLCPIIGLDHA